MMGDMMKLKSMQQQNALAEQQMGDLTAQRNRAAALDAAYRNAYNPQTGEIDYNTIAGALAKGGQGTAIPGLMKTRDEQLKARYDSLESFNKALSEEGKVFKSQMQQLDLNDPNAPTLMAQFIRGHHAPGSLTAELLNRQGITPQQSLSALENAVKTGKFADFYTRSMLGADEFIRRNTLTASEQSMADDRAEQRGISRGQLGVAQRNAAVNEAAEARQAANVGAPIPPKDRQKRDAAFPQASAGLRGAVNEIDTLRADLLALRALPGLAGITGAIEGRLSSLKGSSSLAQAKLDKILARGQFRELQNMRNNSPTGGALGAISDRENASLRSAFASLDQRQELADFQTAIDDAVAQLDFSKGNITQAFDDTYSYRQGAAPAGAPAAPAVAGPRKTKSGVTYTVEE
jgi:hypothetical protein